MYDDKFSKIYNEYGWDYFSITMGKAILDYIEVNNIKIKNNLDLCCGVGTLCDFFNKNNIDTCGVDISSSMLDIAKKKNSNIQFIENDITNYKTTEKYDLITMTCDSFNHITENHKINLVLQNVYQMLQNGGYFIFDIYDEEKIHFDTEIISNRDNNVKVHYYITKKRNLINTNVRVKKTNKLVYETDILEKIYKTDEILKLLSRNNFNIVKLSDRIMNEEQRFKDKLYIICKKIVQGGS